MAGGGGQGGQGGIIGMLGRINQAEQIGNPGSPGYIAPSQLSRGPSLGNAIISGAAPAFQGSTQGGLKAGAGPMNHIAPMPTMQDNFVQPAAPAAPQMSPLAQQMMQRSMAPQPIMGLPAALMQMRGQLNQPMMRAPMPQYGTQGNPLGYRPNMAPAMEALNRVKPSVYKTDLDAARARIAELEGQLQPQDTGYYGGGG
jgi:hypothetical protein